MATLTIDTILSFDDADAEGATQLFGEIDIPLNTGTMTATQALEDYFFPQVARNIRDGKRKSKTLYKISTSANWGAWEEANNKTADIINETNGKWYFIASVNPLDAMEQDLADIYGFGKGLK